jgi:hypothetical protein
VSPRFRQDLAFEPTYGCQRSHALAVRRNRFKSPNKKLLATSGADSVYYATRLRGASNTKARNELNFRPRPLEWLEKGQ